MYKIITICCGNVNCYLIHYGSYAILIDTAKEKYRTFLLDKLKDYNITLIILTHGHYDHIANAAFLAKHFNTKIAMHKDDYKLSKNNLMNTIYSNSNSFLGNITKKAFLKSFKKANVDDFEPDIFLEDGQNLKSFGIDAKIIHLPGHTKGSIGVLLNKNELIAGDVFMNFLYPCESLIVEDLDMLRKSINKIEGLNLKLLYPGHGGPITSVKVNF
ncbi:Glyoxylase, beta-lactamase superfamily II [Clostridium sp. DSM 8431]|uniref:MBL fold metallo-hydrolase n=1 Tax=Clostridium sp. DSM 8431 TaxID=1761781 RepID=UPI0008F10ABB|nr:MBL fold metallo-hydrolase [Clostridium sp. DSM 8431]SFU49206.1 Glyoxylase, beta-lactamase superfamily II [Clostridium sp. DSM 8431]